MHILFVISNLNVKKAQNNKNFVKNNLLIGKFYDKIKACKINIQRATSWKQLGAKSQG